MTLSNLLRAENKFTRWTRFLFLGIFGVQGFISEIKLKLNKQLIFFSTQFRTSLVDIISYNVAF